MECGPSAGVAQTVGAGCEDEPAMAALVAFVTAPDGRAALVRAGGEQSLELVGSVDQLVSRAAVAEAEGATRWVWWSAAVDAQRLASAGLPLARCWDVAEAHRLLV